MFETILTSENRYNFHLKAGSPAMNKGVEAGVNLDLDGKPRPVAAPDLGAYEVQ